MLTDAQLLDDVPEFLSVGSLLKAFPRLDGGRRLVFMEASNEGLDQTQEVVLAKALAEQAAYYERYGNLDLEHTSVIGAKLGIPDYLSYEIGQPIEVRQRDGVTFVKAELYQAAKGKITTPMVDKANMVWDSMTKLSPPQRWFPSVGGAVLHKTIQTNAAGERYAAIDKVRWSNVGISKTPANPHVQGCSVIPMEVFAKALAPGGSGTIDWTMAKTLTAGYGTDAATLSGGAALRKQSLDGSPRASRDGMNYWQFRERLASAMRSGKAGSNPDLAGLITFSASEFGLSQDEAAQHVERFASDLKNGISRGKAKT